MFKYLSLLSREVSGGNADLAVRRQIILSLKLNSRSYSETLKPLVSQAIEIARNHEDQYIRHRVEVQLGNENLLLPIPSSRDGERGQS